MDTFIIICTYVCVCVCVCVHQHLCFVTWLGIDKKPLSAIEECIRTVHAPQCKHLHTLVTTYTHTRHPTCTGNYYLWCKTKYKQVINSELSILMITLSSQWLNLPHNNYIELFHNEERVFPSIRVCVCVCVVCVCVVCVCVWCMCVRVVLFSNCFWVYYE